VLNTIFPEKCSDNHSSAAAGFCVRKEDNCSESICKVSFVCITRMRGVDKKKQKKSPSVDTEGLLCCKNLYQFINENYLL
jgi:hypothetical protein